MFDILRNQGYHLFRLLAPWTNNARLNPLRRAVLTLEHQTPSRFKLDFHSARALAHYRTLLERPAVESEEECPKKPVFERDSLLNRIMTEQYAANSVCEDSVCAYQLKTAKGYLVAVFDGHGGPQLATFSSTRIGEYLQQALKHSGQDTKTTSNFTGALEKAYDMLEDSCLQLVQKEVGEGKKKVKNAGTCALTVVVSGNTVYVANAGDSKGILVSQEGEHLSCVKVSRKFNTASKKERERLRRQFGEQVLVEHPSCALYIRGRLQTTRSIGDFYLKREEFNFAPQLPDFQGPYVSHRPEVREFQLTPQSRYLVVASDGLWDELTRFEVTKLLLTSTEPDKASILVAACLQKVADRHHCSVEQIEQLPREVKRSYHDDISVVVVDLTGQYSH